MWKRKPREIPADRLLEPGEIVRVRTYSGSRADEEPRAIVVGGRELAVEAVEWRALVESPRGHARVFVVRAAGKRVRLALRDDAWEIERILPG